MGKMLEKTFKLLDTMRTGSLFDRSGMLFIGGKIWK